MMLTQCVLADDLALKSAEAKAIQQRSEYGKTIALKSNSHHKLEEIQLKIISFRLKIED
jgi:hypothetical protein